MYINELAERIHTMAIEHGWWDNPDSPEEWALKILLIHSELSEAVEELREPVPMAEYYAAPDAKPSGWAVEIADAIIRSLDLLAAAHVDIDDIINTKMKYNADRPHRHGKTF